MSESRASSSRPSLPRRVVHRLLADSRRRTVLAVLDDHETPMGLDDLARAVAAHDDEGVERAAAVRRDIGEIVVSLHHVHLPKLDDHDVVEYDRTAKAVTTGETFDHVVDRSNDDPQ